MATPRKKPVRRVAFPIPPECPSIGRIALKPGVTSFRDASGRRFRVPETREPWQTWGRIEAVKTTRSELTGLHRWEWHLWLT